LPSSAADLDLEGKFRLAQAFAHDKQTTGLYAVAFALAILPFDLPVSKHGLLLLTDGSIGCLVALQRFAVFCSGAIAAGRDVVVGLAWRAGVERGAAAPGAAQLKGALL
jgi:hypothetical protein